MGQDEFLLILVPHLAEMEACRTGPLDLWGPPGPLRTMAGGCSVKFFRTLQRLRETYLQTGEEIILVT